MNSIEIITNRILTDDKTADIIEYMMSKAISSSVSPTVKFIYKKYKIVKNKRKYYSIYNLYTGQKLYSNIKYQDMAKYIIDNINDPYKINNIIELEGNVSRLQDKIEFLKQQYMRLSNKELIECKLYTAYSTYRKYKRELLDLIGKKNIC